MEHLTYREMLQAARRGRAAARADIAAGGFANIRTMDDAPMVETMTARELDLYAAEFAGYATAYTVAYRRARRAGMPADTVSLPIL